MRLTFKIILNEKEYIRDIICNVLARECSKKQINKVLNHFIPDYEKINLDYCCPVDNDEYVFKSEDEMVRYFITNKELSQTFYWNKYRTHLKF